MNQNVPTIKQELNRRFALCLKEVKRHNGLKETVVIFPAVYDYLAFIEATPLLVGLIVEDREQQEDLHTELLFEHIHKPEAEVIMDMNFDNFNDFHLCNKYDYLKEFIYDPIYRLNHEIEPTKMDAWGLAFTKSPYRTLVMPIPWKQKIEVIKNKIKRGDEELQAKIAQTLTDVHNRLLGLLVEYEVKPKEEPNKTLELSQVVLKLGLTQDSKWEDMTITFRNKFDVKITYKDKEFLTNHEDMGFSDKRRPDEIRAKASWALLRVLAMQGGTFPLSRLTGKDRVSSKKQKQALAKSLKDYFQISTDPFHELTKEESEYKIKIKLVPEPESREQWEDRNIFETTRNYPKEYLGKY